MTKGYNKTVSRKSMRRQAENEKKFDSTVNALDAPPAPDGYRQRWLELK